MAKDPAFLFYSQDFYTGVATLNWEDRGKYISILCLMHQQGRMSEETIRFLVGSVSDNLRAKFRIDGDGMWYNVRLEAETARRNTYTESRRLNGNKGGRPKKEKPSAEATENHKVNHTDNRMGNENEIVIENQKEKERPDKLAIFETLFADQIFLEQMQMAHPGKNYKAAFEECWLHFIVTPNPPRQVWEWKQKLNTWLSIKAKEHGNPKKQQSDSIVDDFTKRAREHFSGGNGG